MTATGWRNLRLALWALVALAGVAAAALYIVPRQGAGVAQFGAGDYALVTHEGEAADASIFVGRPSAVFFGFTHCPDVCPTTLADMRHWFETLGEEAGDLRAFFVTVDPERDTPQVLGEYVRWASDRITGLTGEPAEIDKIVRAWGVLAEKVPYGNGDYTMNHTASVFLLDRNGDFFGTIAYEESSETAIAKLRRLVSGA